MKAYFDRTEPYYLSKEPSFDGIEVDVSSDIFRILDSRKETLVRIENAIEEAGAPEDSAQALTDLFVDLLEDEERITRG